jgi:tetratricopeptide (TPR) repeat protein
VSDVHDISATELEILHGALNSPATATSAYFYLRDPGWLGGPGADQRDYESESPSAATQLNALKERIRASGLPIRYYRDPVDGAEQAFGDMKSLIESHFPDPITAADREESLQWSFARQRRGCQGLEGVQGRIEKHLRKSKKPLVIFGQAGAGKSTLVAASIAPDEAGENGGNRPQTSGSMGRLLGGLRRIARSTGNSADEHQAWRFPHYVAAGPLSSDWVFMLGRVMSAIRQRYDLALPVPEDPVSLVEEFPNFLHAIPSDAQVVLFLDGLDQLEGGVDPTWLPQSLPPNVRLVASCGPGRILDILRSRGWAALEVTPLDRPDRIRVTQNYLSSLGKNLALEHQRLLASAPQTGNPAFLLGVLHEIRIVGKFDALTTQISECLATQDLPQLHRLVLDRLTDRFEARHSGLIDGLLSLLSSSRYGLSEAELSELLGSDGPDGRGTPLPLPAAELLPVLLAIRPLLAQHAGIWAASSAGARELMWSHVARGRDINAARQEAHRRLARYFQAHPESERRDDELPWHLVALKDWQRLGSLLADPAWLARAWTTRQAEIKAYWRQVEQHSSLRMSQALPLVIRSAKLQGAAPGTGSSAAWPILNLLKDAGHFQAALNLLPPLETAARSAANLDHLQALLALRAALLGQVGDPHGALAALLEQERLCATLGREAALAACLTSQGVIRRMLGDADAAMSLCQNAEQVCRRINDRFGLAAALGNQAVLWRDRARPVEAVGLFKAQETICRLLGDRPGLQRCLGNQAVLEADAGRYEASLRLHQEERAICLLLNDSIGLSQSLGNEARVREKLADYDAAIQLLQEKETICRESKDVVGLIYALAQQAHVFGIGMGHPLPAMRLASEALDMARRHDLRQAEAEASRLIERLQSGIEPRR